MYRLLHNRYTSLLQTHKFTTIDGKRANNIIIVLNVTSYSGYVSHVNFIPRSFIASPVFIDYEIQINGIAI